MTFKWGIFRGKLLSSIACFNFRFPSVGTYHDDFKVKEFYRYISKCGYIGFFSKILKILQRE